MIYIFFVAFMILLGIVLVKYEIHCTRRDRSERIRERARRAVRRDR